MGAIYRRPNSPFLWIKYYVNGRPVRESTGTAKEKEAKEFLKRREGAAAEGKPVSPRLDRLRYEEARADLLAHYEATGSRDLSEAGYRLQHLDPMFAGRRIATIGPTDAMRYTVRRRDEGAADGTIRRELSTLTTMLNLAAEHGKLLRVPKLRKPPDGKPRQGFLEPEQFAGVSRHLAPDLQVAAAVGYVLGWRCQSEVMTLERRHLDLDAGTLRLDPETKTDEGRIVYLTPELQSLLGAQVARVDALQKTLGRIIPCLLPHFANGRRHKAGDQRKDYKRAWVTASKNAGVPGTLRHDMRRSAVRNMVTRHAIAERVAMTITGHKTRRVFDAYHIVSPGDLQAAAAKMAGTLTGTQSVSRRRRVDVTR
jgi:integrase